MKTTELLIEANLKRNWKNVPRDALPKIIKRTSQHISKRENSGEIISIEMLNEDIIPTMIIAYIRHNKTGYDYLLNRGVPKEEARRQIKKYVDGVFKYWTRKY